jgi:hypothetical protein
MMKRDQENEVFLKLIVTDGRVRGWHPAVPFIYTFPAWTRHLRDSYTTPQTYRQRPAQTSV